MTGCLFTTAQSRPATFTDSLLKAMESTKTDTARVNMLIGLSGAYRQGDVTKEFYYADAALDISGKIHWEQGRMYAEQLIGDCYNRVMAYQGAIMHFKLCIDAAKKLKRIDVEEDCYKHIVYACYRMNEYAGMVLYQKTLLELAQQAGDPLDISNQMNAYALRLSDAGKYADAVSYWQKNIAFAAAKLQGVEKDKVLANILNTLANTYVKTHKPDSALYCLRKAASLIALTDDSNKKAYITSTFCDVYESTRTDDSAEIYGERTVKWGEILRNEDLQQHYCATLSRVYEDDHKPALALKYYKMADSLKDVINNTRRTIDEAMQVAKISMDQQAERIALEKRSFETTRRNQRAALIASLVAMITFIVLTVFIYRNLRQKQKANRTISLQAASLQQQNEVIDKALKEKEVLLKETHHRIKNNLQLISSLLELQAANMEDEGAKDALRTAQRRVLSIATVHSKLYGSNDDEAIEFSAFTTDLFSRLATAFNGDGRDLQFNNAMPPTYLPLNIVVLLGLILNELITNSFKHAFKAPGAAVIGIHFATSGEICSLRYHDNGPGLAEGAFTADTGSLGLYLVRRLSKQLKGSADYMYDASSTFIITFPHAAS